MAWAINSLPVPVSPSRSTLASVGATRSTSTRADFRAGLLPMIGSDPGSACVRSTKFKLDTVHLHEGELWEAPRTTSEWWLEPRGCSRAALRHRKADTEN